MPFPLAPVTLTAGASVTVNVGSTGTVGAVVIGNESPYALQASAGSGGIWVYGQMADRLNCNTSAFGGNLTLTTQDYLTNSSVAPSFLVFLTVYAPGEAIPGTYPCALSRMFNLGNTVTTNATTPNSLEQDIVTPFVYSGLIATQDATTANRLDVTSGVAFARQSDQSIGRVAPLATNFSTTQINSTYYLDLNPDGTYSFALTHSSIANYLTIAQVTTDASGNINGVTDERTLTTTLFSADVGGQLAFGPHLSNVTVPAPQPGLYASDLHGTYSEGNGGGLPYERSLCVIFDGATGYANVPTTGLPTGNSAWSLEAWFNLAALGAFQMLVTMGGNATKTGAFLYVDSTNHLTADLFNAHVSATGTVTNGVWYHAVATWDGTNLTLYQDGVQVATSAALGPDNISYGVATLAAQFTTVYGSFLNGALQYAAIYGTALSATRVSEHYAVGAMGSATTTYIQTVRADTPLRLYPLGDTSGRGVAMNAAGSFQQVITSDGGISPTYVNAVAGQTTVGAFGVPVIVAQAINVHVTATTAQTVLTMTVPATGLYRVSGSIFSGNTGTVTPAFLLNWIGANMTGANVNTAFAAPNGIPYDGAHAIALNFDLPCWAGVFYVKGGSTLSVTYQDSSGTPNDYASALVERLS